MVYGGSAEEAAQDAEGLQTMRTLGYARLDTPYIDLLLIHQPAGNYVAGYRQMEKAYKEGRTIWRVASRTVFRSLIRISAIRST